MNSYVIGTVGNINRIKGYEYFLSAARQIKLRIPNSVFLIVGEPIKTQMEYYKGLLADSQTSELKNSFLFYWVSKKRPPGPIGYGCICFNISL